MAKHVLDKISIWRGDITKLEVDAIVNAANSRLQGGKNIGYTSITWTRKSKKKIVHDVMFPCQSRLKAKNMIWKKT